MKKINNGTFYPENAYCAVFGKETFPNLPSDAEETLEYLMGALLQPESNLFMLRYRDAMTYSEIGQICGNISGERARQIVAKASRKLRHPSRSEVLLIGREAHLQSVVAKNEEKKRRYSERIVELEELIQKQGTEITGFQRQLLGLKHQMQPTDNALSASIDFLDLSARSWNSLMKAGIKTVKDIIDFDDLLKIPNLGRVSAREIQDKLRAFANANE